ncbi:MAG TPA: hypothetical protein ENN40_05180 [Candidatus Aminicenantes bacterium]|nr:hypothetical protein [Candidatus Aminicenantes bacterium]
MIHAFNYFFTRVMRVIMVPFDRLGDFWGILFLSLLSSLVVLLVYRWVSSPRRIRHAKDQIKASILAIRMYRDFWRVTLGAFARSLVYTIKYFALNLAPLLLILPILVPVFAQMEARYGMRPFQPGEHVVLKARLNTDVSTLDVNLNTGNEVLAAMNPVVVTALNEVNWKLRVEAPGFHQLTISGPGFSATKRLVAGDKTTALSNRRYARSTWAHFWYPVEPLLKEAGPVESISLRYPGKRVSFLGTRIHWIWHYLVLMLILVLGLRKRFGVEF